MRVVEGLNPRPNYFLGRGAELRIAPYCVITHGGDGGRARGEGKMESGGEGERRSGENLDVRKERGGSGC